MGQGAWVDDHGKRIVEDVQVVDVAMTDTSSNAHKLWLIALSYGQEAKQDCVYVRYPNGQVELVNTRENELKVAA